MATTSASLDSGAPTKVTPKVPKKATITASTKLPPNPFLFEVLELANKQKTVAKRVEVLQQYRYPGLVSVLIWNFDESCSIITSRGSSSL